MNGVDNEAWIVPLPHLAQPIQLARLLLAPGFGDQ